jgi:AcrR family transcriptional regulator
MGFGMGRRELHSAQAILDGARTVLLADNPATIAEIAMASGAPAGSIYHRFESRDVLLAETWIRASAGFQRRFIAAIGSAGGPVDAAVAAGLSVFDFADDQCDDARLLASLRREQVIRSPLPPQLASRLDELDEPVESAIARLAHDLYGMSWREHRRRVVLATIDIPHGAIRQFLIAGAPPPQSVRPLVEHAIRAVLGAQLPPGSTGTV